MRIQKALVFVITSVPVRVLLRPALQKPDSIQRAAGFECVAK